MLLDNDSSVVQKSFRHYMQPSQCAWGRTALAEKNRFMLFVMFIYGQLNTFVRSASSQTRILGVSQKKM